MEVLAEIVGWFLGVVGTAAGGGVILLLRWQRRTERHIAQIQQALSMANDAHGSVTDMERRLQEVRLYVAERYMRREDIVPSLAQFDIKIDGLAALVARVDERTRMMSGPKERIDRGP